MNMKALKREAVEISGDRKIATVCLGHTHPISAIAATGVATSENAPSAPPSLLDTSLMDYSPIREQFIDKMNAQEMTQEKLFKAVFEPRGIWYYRPANGNDIQTLDPEYSAFLQKESAVREQLNDIAFELRSWFEELSDGRIKEIVSSMSKTHQDDLQRYVANDQDYETGAKDRIVNILVHSPQERSEFARAVLSAEQGEQFRQMRHTLEQWDILSEKQAGYMKEVADMTHSFAKNSVSATFDFQTEYTELRQAYLRGQKIKMRFVPWEKVDQEPPCAGPDQKE